MDETVFFALCLLNIKGLGFIRTRRLLEQKGAAEAFLSGHKDFGSAQAAAEKELRLAQKLNVGILSFKDVNYPPCLLKLSDPPPLLYLAGQLTTQMDIQGFGIGIIGTRQATRYGLEMAEAFGQRLAQQDLWVVSGLARGIDTAAHQGALKTGKTLAILGSGLAHLYPRENETLARKIAAGGALISEFPLNTPPHPYNFPQRNRLVSSFSKALLLVEAPLKSGAMGTMMLGKGQGRALFALPGRADSENFKGNHLLIKKGIARLVETPDEIGEFLGKSTPETPEPPCNQEEEQLLRFFPPEEICLDELSARTGYPAQMLNTQLMRLVLKGIIREYPGKKYRRKLGF